MSKTVINRQLRRMGVARWPYRMRVSLSRLAAHTRRLLVHPCLGCTNPGHHPCLHDCWYRMRVPLLKLAAHTRRLLVRPRSFALTPAVTRACRQGTLAPPPLACSTHVLHTWFLQLRVSSWLAWLRHVAPTWRLQGDDCELLDIIDEEMEKLQACAPPHPPSASCSDTNHTLECAS